MSGTQTSPMKIVFIVYADVYSPGGAVVGLLDELGIDFYTRWERVKGKGHGTEAHLGTASFPAENTVLMIAFQEDASLNRLIEGIVTLNERISRPDERIRLFQIPLERMV